MARTALLNPGWIRSTKRGLDDAPAFEEVSNELAARLRRNPVFMAEAMQDADYIAIASALLDDDALQVARLLTTGIEKYLKWQLDYCEYSDQWEKELGRLESAFFPAPRFAA